MIRRKLMKVWAALNGKLRRHGGCTVFKHGVSMWGTDSDVLMMLKAAVNDLERTGYDMRYVKREIRRMTRKGGPYDVFEVQSTPSEIR